MPLRQNQKKWSLLSKKSSNMKDQFPELFLENQLCFPLYATSRLITKLYTPFLKELDITYPQYLVLLALWQNDKLSVKSIGEALFLESNTLTPLLKRLEQKNIIQRNRSSQDERAVIVSLTSKGSELKYLAKEIPHKIVASFQEADMNETEIIGFQKNLFQLLKILKHR